MKRTNKIKSVIALTLALLGSGMAQAEVNKVVFGHQTGWAYMPLYIMQEQKLVEKHAKAFESPRVPWRPVGLSQATMAA